MKTPLLAEILQSIRTATPTSSVLVREQEKHRSKRVHSQIRRPVTCIFVILGSAFLTNCTPFEKADWKQYDITDGNFAISLPISPSTRKETMDIGGEQIDVKFVYSEIGSLAYGVAYCDYPGGNVLSDSPQEFFDEVQSGMAQRNKGKIVSTKKVSVDRFTGREIQMSVPDGTHYIRLFYVRFRLFQVHAVVLDGDAAKAEVSKFLNSFRLLKT